MAGIQDYFEFTDDFFGGGTFGTSASESDPWVVADTSTSGTPTYTRVDGAATGEAALDLASTSEVENVYVAKPSPIPIVMTVSTTT